VTDTAGKTKILYVSHSARLAGAEISLLTLLRHLDPALFEPVLILPSEGPLLEEVERLRLKTYISPLERWIRSSWRRPDRAGGLAERIRRVARIIEEERPRIVQTNTSVIWEGALAARTKGVPHIWHLHEILEGHPRLKPLLPLPLVYGIMDDLSRRIVVVSRAVGARLSEHIAPDKIVTIPNGVDVGQAGPAEDRSVLRELGLAAGVPVAATVGSLAREKGHSVLLDALSLVRKKGGRLNVLIVGAGSRREVRNLNRRIRDLGLDRSVFYLGFRGDVPRILAGCDFLIVPSLTEAFSLVILEAMAAGRPVVATDCGGPSELIRDGRTGFLVPVNDPEPLGDAILKLAADRTRRIEMGETAWRELDPRFTARGFASSFQELYRDVARANASRGPLDEDDRLVADHMKVYQDHLDDPRWMEGLRPSGSSRLSRLARIGRTLARRLASW
jgi:glycosyltransferase involved in cell wall biosynthesis